jgi:DNA polymerase III subunit delta
MQVRPEAFYDRLGRAAPAAVWVHGNEPLLVIEAADAFRAKARADGFTEREVIQMERGVSASQLIAAGASQSLFGDRSLVELRLKTGKLAKDMGEALAQISTNAHDAVRILVTSERLERGVAETAWFKQFDSAAWVVAVYPLERAQLPTWIAERLARQQHKASAPTLAMMAERVEGNLLAAKQEIAKLALLLPPGAIEFDDVAQVLNAVSRYSPFELADAMLAGDGARAMRSLDGLKAEGAPLTLIVWALADALRQLLRVSTSVALGQQPMMAAKAQRAPLPRERLLERAAYRHNSPTLMQLLQKLASADKMSKGIRSPIGASGSADVWQLLADTVRLVATTPKNSKGKLSQQHGYR